ncbi:hypothetical protein ACWY2R_03585 [Enterococcus avium]
MKKHVLIETILILTISGISFWNIQQQQENVSLRESVADYDEKQKELTQKQEELLQENEHLSAEAESSLEALMEMRKTEASSGADVDSKSDFINIVTKLFEANLNFTPENYESKKKEVASYLSEELNKEYFGQKRNTYQEANDTISRLEHLDIYTKTLRNYGIEGLVVVNFESKKEGKTWEKSINIFQVTYQNKSKKITKVINLGSGYSDTFPK